MPQKLKKMSSGVNQHSRSAGFLRPTMASQRRSVVGKMEGFSVKPSGRKRTTKLTKSKAAKEQVHPSHHERDMKSAVEIYQSTTTSESSSSRSKSNDENQPFELTYSKPHETNALLDAKRMCADLQQQINQLKVNQETLNRSFAKSEANNPMEKAHLTNSQKSDHPMMAGDLQHSIHNPMHPNSVIRVNIQKNSKPLYDASNMENELPNVQAYHSTFRKRNTQESVIKKLHSERDKYKHKVLRLQTELKLVKRGKDNIIKSPELSLSDVVYYNTNVIGEGHLATVYSGTFNGKQVAVKKISKLGMMTSSDCSYLSAEAGLLIHLQHRNIVKILGVCLSSMEPLIVLELVHGKTLLMTLESSGGRLSPGQFFSISRDVAIGMAYLHNQKPPVLHLNLRPSNVLIDTFGRAKVTDFGFSKIRLSAGLSHHNSLAYLAPELTSFPVQLTGKIDVFAYAVLLWQCHTCSDPANGLSTSEILDMLQKNERLPLGPELPHSFHILISKCWATSPIQRPTFKVIILELETMGLPEDWSDNLKVLGISRMDTSDMGSSSHDTTSLSSQMTDSSRRHTTSTSIVDPGQTVEPQGKHGTMGPSHTRSYKSSQLVSSTQTQNRKDPTPCNEVRYVSKGLQEQIGRPEIVNQPGRVSALGLDRIPPQVSHSSKPYYNRESARPYVSPIRYSKFDDKFHDFVSRACEAESVSKAHARRPSQWEKLRQKVPSSSSDPIRVYSLSTPSETTDGNGSATTALYRPDFLHEKDFLTSAGDLLKQEYKRSNEVLSNAKRLLLNSPIDKRKNEYKLTSTYGDAGERYAQRKMDSKLKSEPSRYRRNYDRDTPKTDFKDTMHSPRSDAVSTESFLPLPPALGSHGRSSFSSKASPAAMQLLENSTRRESSDYQTDQCDMVPCKGNQRDGSSTSGDKDDKLTSVLQLTADQLNEVSNVLYNAADETRVLS
uniref:Probable serine/threonine-protein kinase DDB_G0267514 n=1 Tax=Phallusia mammillata TaxID=59560 RepID=A0A6F9DKW8_9ASCI|nr:probable serine/threonine-protein kinase DDB_G0267514 [Phallusia mammillata]